MSTKYRALVDLSLRKAPTPGAKGYDDWHNWPAGTEFTPPKHMDIQKALARQIVEKVSGG